MGGEVDSDSTLFTASICHVNCIEEVDASEPRRVEGG